jgi:hypothetical protein
MTRDYKDQYKQKFHMENPMRLGFPMCNKYGWSPVFNKRQLIKWSDRKEIAKLLTCKRCLESLKNYQL